MKTKNLELQGQERRVPNSVSNLLRPRALDIPSLETWNIALAPLSLHIRDFQVPQRVRVRLEGYYAFGLQTLWTLLDLEFDSLTFV